MGYFNDVAPFDDPDSWDAHGDDIDPELLPDHVYAWDGEEETVVVDVVPVRRGRKPRRSQI